MAGSPKKKIVLVAGETGIETEFKKGKIDVPPRFDEFVKYRTRCLETAGLAPGRQVTVNEVDDLSIGQILYLSLDMYNADLWTHDSAISRTPSSPWPGIVADRIEHGRDSLLNIVSSELSLLEIDKSSIEVKRYMNAGELMYDYLRFLNEGNTDRAVGVIKELLAGHNPFKPTSASEFNSLTPDQKLGDLILKALKESKDGPAGILKSYLGRPIDTEIVYVKSVRKDVMAIAARIKRGERAAEKLAYRSAMLDMVLYDFLLNYTQFKGLVKLYNEKKASDRIEERITARRLKFYHDIYAELERYGKRDDMLREGVKVFGRKFKELMILDDIFGNKPIPRDFVAKLRLFKKMFPHHTTDLATINNWHYVPDRNSPGRCNMSGFYVREIDNHIKADRLCSILQVKIGEEALGQPSARPDVYEVALHRARDVCYDLIDPQAGHVKYEEEKRKHIQDLPDWIIQQYVLRQRYAASMFREVDTQSSILFGRL